jgi:WD40 repeat protein
MGAAIWNAITGRRISTLTSGVTTDVAISFDGTYAATCGLDGIALWDVASGRKLSTLVAGIDAKGLQAILAAIEASAFTCSFSNDGRQLVTYARYVDRAKKHVNELVVWDVRTVRRIAAADISDDLKHVAFSNDGRQVILTQGSRIVFHDASTLEITRTLTHSGHEPNLVILSPVGNHLFDGKAIWDIETGRIIRVLEGRMQGVSSVAFIPGEGRFLVGQRNQQFAALVDLTTLATVNEFNAGPGRTVDVCCISADGRKLFGSVDSEPSSLAAFDVATARETSRFPIGDKAYDVQINADGSRALTTSENSAYVWDTFSGRLMRTFDGPTPPGYAYLIYGWSALSPDGNHVLVESHYASTFSKRQDEKNVVGKLYSVATGSVVRVLKVAGSGTKKVEYRWRHVGFSPDGTLVFAAGEEKNIGSTPKGKTTGAICFWNARTGDRGRFLRGHNKVVTRVTFSANGRFLVSQSYDGTAIVWEVTTGALLRRFSQIEQSGQPMSLSPDGRLLAIAGRDSVIRIWDVYTGERLIDYMRLSEGNDWLAVTPQGLFDGTEAGRQQVAFRIGSGLNVVPVDRFFQDFYRPGLAAELFGGPPYGGGGERPLPDVQIAAAVPPMLRIISPTDSIVDSDEVTIDVEAQDQGGGIQGPWLRHNGARIPAAGEARREGDRQFHTFQVRLVEGENWLRVEGASADGSWESEPAEIRLTYAPRTPEKEKPVLHILAVGVEKYAEGALSLHYSSDDAQALVNLFRARGQALYAEVRPQALLDEQVTRDQLRAAIQQVADTARPEDTLLVFLSGHGVTVGQRYYFIPHDMRREAETFEEDVQRGGIPGDAIADWIGTVPALKRMLVLDTCHSGAAVRLAGGRGRDPFAFRGAVERLSRAQGIFTLAASTADEAAAEVPDLKHGILSYALLAGLKAIEQGPLAGQHIQTTNPDQVVDVLEWFSYASGHVPRLSKKFTGQDQTVEMHGRGEAFPVLPLEPE